MSEKDILYHIYDELGELIVVLYGILAKNCDGIDNVDKVLNTMNDYAFRHTEISNKIEEALKNENSTHE